MTNQDEKTIADGFQQAEELRQLVDSIIATREVFDATGLYERMGEAGFFAGTALYGEAYANQSAIGNLFQALTDVSRYVEGTLFADVPIQAVDPNQEQTVADMTSSKRQAFAVVRH